MKRKYLKSVIQTKQISHEAGAAHMILLILMIVLLLVFVGYSIVQQESENSNGQSSGIARSTDGANCTTTDGLEMCIEYPTGTMTRAERLNVNVDIRNVTDSLIQVSFPTICDAPERIVNGINIDAGRMCGAAMKVVDIAEGESQEYELTVPTFMMEAGENILEIVWSEMKSDQIVLIYDDAEYSYEECYTAGPQSDLENCELIYVEFNEELSTTITNYEKADQLLSEFGVKSFVRNADFFSEGGVYIVVPANRANEWRQTLSESDYFEWASES